MKKLSLICFISHHHGALVLWEGKITLHMCTYWTDHRHIIQSEMFPVMDISETTEHRCFKCENVLVPYDSLQGAYVSEECDYNHTMETCQEGQVWFLTRTEYLGFHGS